MSYYFSKKIEADFDEVVKKTVDALKSEGFGVLTEIDVKKTLKNKLDVDFRRYVILGACNPPFAYKALTAEDKIGLMLPCNVIVQEWDKNMVEISVIDPAASMQAVQNNELEKVAVEVRAKLQNVLKLV